jgi:hypothetical protein
VVAARPEVGVSRTRNERFQKKLSFRVHETSVSRNWPQQESGSRRKTCARRRRDALFCYMLDFCSSRIGLDAPGWGRVGTTSPKKVADRVDETLVCQKKVVSRRRDATPFSECSFRVDETLVGERSFLKVLVSRARDDFFRMQLQSSPHLSLPSVAPSATQSRCLA